MRLSRLAVLPLTAGLALGGVVAAASGAPVVTNVLATLPASSQPSTIVVDGAANVYTLNSGTNTISKVSFDGTLTPTWATFLVGVTPRDMVTKTDGTLYTANSGAGTISRVMPDGTLNPAYATLGPLTQPRGLAITGDGTLYTANSGTRSISKVDPAGVVTAMFATLGPGTIPFDIAVSPAGDLYTLNLNLTVSKVTAGGVVTVAFATLAAGVDPSNLVVNSDGHVFVLESTPNQIQEFTATGGLARTIALPSRAGQIAIDALGNVFVTLRDAKTIGLVPHDGGAFVPSIAPLTPGTDYIPLAVTTTNTVYAAGLSTPIISRISLGAKITSAPVHGEVAVGGAFSATVTASGYEPLTYALRGRVPAGMTINPTTGVISGPPTATGDYAFSVVASNLFGESSTQEATLLVNPAPTPTPTPTTTTSAPAPTSAPAAAAGGTSRGATSLAQTGVESLLPAGIAALVIAAGAIGLVAERRRRRA